MGVIRYLWTVPCLLRGVNTRKDDSMLLIYISVLSVSVGNLKYQDNSHKDPHPSTSTHTHKLTDTNTDRNTHRETN